MRTLGKLRTIAIAILAVGLSTPAHADIKSFNAAMQAKDYKKAAAEAAATWSTLDTSRTDLPVIANEFGFAAFMAADYQSARTFATTALAGATDNAFRIGAELLLRFSEFKLAPSGATRDKLQTALEASATLPGIDLVTFLGVNALVAYDVETDGWRAARVSAALGENLTGRGKGKPSVENLTFGLIRASATYAVNRDMNAYRDLVALNDKIFAAIDTATTVEEAARFAPAFWQLRAWQEAAGAQLRSDRDFKREFEKSVDHNMSVHAARLGLIAPPPGTCVLDRPSFSRAITYPDEARYMGVAGTVIVKVDVEESGAVTNPSILAAVPQRYFGDAVMAGINRMKFTKATNAEPRCTFAQKDKVFTYIFEMRN